MKTMYRYYIEDKFGHIRAVVRDNMKDIIRLHGLSKSDKDLKFVSAVICYVETEL